ncbi:MAG: hypothetical protein HC848_04480 [Limnobacter sp.]|nr:hypothetical protein [Limnobacter sp.]
MASFPTAAPPDAHAFPAVFQWLQAQGCALHRLLWVLPRVESTESFRQAWAAHHNYQPVPSPALQTADRLSSPAGRQSWLALQGHVVALLQARDGLVLGLSHEQIWALASEYLQLARRYALARRAPAVLGA